MPFGIVPVNSLLLKNLSYVQTIVSIKLTPIKNFIKTLAVFANLDTASIFENFNPTKELVYLTIVVYIIVFIMLGIYKPFYARNYLDTIAYFGALILYYGSFILLKTRFKLYIWPLLYLTNIIMQILLFDRYSQGIWVG